VQHVPDGPGTQSLFTLQDLTSVLVKELGNLQVIDEEGGLPKTNILVCQRRIFLS
jgi:hypothetical protein